jgi:hypothetical protein
MQTSIMFGSSITVRIEGISDTGCHGSRQLIDPGPAEQVALFFGNGSLGHHGEESGFQAWI